MQIVLARNDIDYIIEQEGRIDLGERHKLKQIYKPVACIWLNNGSLLDKEKANEFAQKEGYTVFCYMDEDNPLERAKKEITFQTVPNSSNKKEKNK